MHISSLHAWTIENDGSYLRRFPDWQNGSAVHKEFGKYDLYGGEKALLSATPKH